MSDIGLTRVDSVDALADTIRHAAAHDAPLRLVGSGTWLHGGGPFDGRSRLSLRALAGVVHYEPGDLVVTAYAGTTLAELDAITRAHGQMLAIAPYGSPESTLGAVVATGTHAPLAFGDLQVRDLVLGLTSVTGTGELVRAGGRVVKNVAGFDLVRLQVGAWGTLGAITEVTLRLHAVPDVDRVVVGTSTRPAATLLAALVANRAPIPMLVVRTPGRERQIWARISGNPARAAALEAHLAQLGVAALHPVTDVRPLHVVPDGARILRVRAPRAHAAALLDALEARYPHATLAWDPVRGTARVILPADLTHGVLDGDAEAQALSTQCGGTTVAVAIDQGRATVRRRTPLEQGVKHALDPRDILNRLGTP